MKILTPIEKRKRTLNKKKILQKKIQKGIKYRNQGFKSINTGDYKEAISYFEKALKLFPVDNIRYDWTIDNLGRAIYFYCKKRMSEIDNFLETDEAKSLEKLLITWQNVKKC